MEYKDIKLIKEIIKEYSTMDGLKEYTKALEKLLQAYKNIKIQLQDQKNINKKLSLEAQKYFDALMEDERVINEMSGYIIGYPIVLDDDAITLKTEEEVIDYFRKKCE